MTTPRAGHTATLLPDGRVLVTGGFGGVAAVSAEIYDPKTGTFGAAGSLIMARYSHSASLLEDGRVLIVGGVQAGNPDTGLLASAELFDPKSGTFIATGSMSTGRERHSATLLPDGRVLVAGGPGNQGTVATAELYDPTMGTFTGTGSMMTLRVGHVALLLQDGRVLIVGVAPARRSCMTPRPASSALPDLCGTVAFLAPRFWRTVESWSSTTPPAVLHKRSCTTQRAEPSPGRILLGWAESGRQPQLSCKTAASSLPGAARSLPHTPTYTSRRTATFPRT